MTRTISQRELRNSSGDIMRGLDEGETYIVTRHGQPVGELTPMRRLRFVAAETVSAALRGAPAIDSDRFRADLDRIVDQGAEPRA
jgi:antitoxin (DNA-binding transcriptional repressor) of toxin-antitoxin stability system